MYLALYRKYRPRVFDDVISQEHITTTLKNQLKNGQSSHAYLFTGSRGTGKTTCAKILAKALNCADLHDGNPCLECESCKNIDNEFSDVTEIDAASNNGVDYVRDLKEDAVYAPMSGKFKVYIIDEVHMLSAAAFNALLKLIEEPPPHVVFILATTEVHKIPATIISRCQRFEFRRIDIGESKKRLLWVAGQENKQLSDDAAFLISKISEGGMRDALSLLDQCFSVTDSVTVDTVRECAGVSGSDHLFNMADCVFASDTAGILKILDELIDRSKDVTRLCEELISHFRILMLLKAGADNSVVKLTADDLTRYREQTNKFTLSQIMRCISILSETFTSMGRVRTPAMLLEMCLIKLCTPSLDADEKTLTARIEKLEQMLANGVTPENYAGHTVTVHEEEKQPVPEPPDTDDLSDFKQLDIWTDIVENLPDIIKFSLIRSNALIKDNFVLIQGSALAVEMSTKDNKEIIEAEISKALGRKIRLISSPDSIITEEKEEKQDKVKEFLDLAESMGITIKRQ
ncbi:MAG: DNA polymerase III subunit gamma/tau [Ruminiclostridium sp.]|nr:DNA polymerase III subunit gamma/tau [Ruminiclostridium sp.]